MKGMIETKSVKVFTTSDGKSWDIKADAERHQAKLALKAWFQNDVASDEAALLVDTILGDVDGFREVVGPLIRKPRASKVVETAAPAAKVKAAA